MLLHERTRKQATRLTLALGVWAPTVLILGLCWRSGRPAAISSVAVRIEAATNLKVRLGGVAFPRPRTIRLFDFELSDPKTGLPVASTATADLIDHGDYLEFRCDELVAAADQLRTTHDLWRHALQRLRVRRRRAVQLVAERVRVQQGEETLCSANTVRAAVSPLRDDWQAWVECRLAGAERRASIRWAAGTDSERPARLYVDTGEGVLAGRLAEVVAPAAAESLRGAELRGTIEIAYSDRGIESATIPGNATAAVRFHDSPLPGMEGDLIVSLNRLELTSRRLRQFDCLLVGGAGRWSVGQLQHASNSLKFSLVPSLARRTSEPVGLGVDYGRVCVRLRLGAERLEVTGYPEADDALLTAVDGRPLASAAGGAVAAAALAEAIAPNNAPWAPQDDASAWLAAFLPESTSRLAAAESPHR